MALSGSEIGIVYPYGHAKEGPAEAQQMNSATMVYLQNTEGSSVTSGDVGYIVATGADPGTFKAADVAQVAAPIVVVARNVDDTVQTIADDASGWFQFAGHCPNINVDAATAIGNWLTTGTTEGSASPDTGTAAPPGAFAVALSATAGAGEVAGVLIPTLPHVRLTNTDTDISTPPTDAELDAEFGTPAAVGDGYRAFIDDAGAGNNAYIIVSDGTNWWHVALTKAV
jgi:hypothetical protein